MPTAQIASQPTQTTPPKMQKKLTTVKKSKKEKIIFHLGPHKTGTTSFQSALAKAEVQINNSGISILNVQSRFSNNYRKWRESYAREIHSFLLEKQDRKVTIERLSRKFSELKEISEMHDSALIVSDENLLGVPPGHFIARSEKRARDFYLATPVVIEAISKAFEGFAVEVILVKRDLKGFLCSSYRDFISKLQKSEDLYEFTDNLSVNFVTQYNDFYKKAASKFNIAVKIYDFSYFTNNTNEIVYELTNCKMTNQQDQIRNKSLSWKAIELAIERIPQIQSPEEAKRFREKLYNNARGGSPKLEAQAKGLIKRLMEKQSSNIWNRATKKLKQIVKYRSK
ncbi:hypothetical protein KUV95_11865 [Microbulbifer agarilyticus]|uniref:hypothetical protein n=1 Tax=Microbulbifer agarilyticus TaxID=260552 RepID=UPI001C9631D1|nr:hypothetical protein [Microbulbifer agarilyticus]MBY6212248.1 hypothetical protein [Microbulbifer agarilyticus]